MGGEAVSMRGGLSGRSLVWELSEGNDSGAVSFAMEGRGLFLTGLLEGTGGGDNSTVGVDRSFLLKMENGMTDVCVVEKRQLCDRGKIGNWISPRNTLLTRTYPGNLQQLSRHLYIEKPLWSRWQVVRIRRSKYAARQSVMMPCRYLHKVRKRLLQ